MIFSFSGTGALHRANVIHAGMNEDNQDVLRSGEQGPFAAAVLADGVSSCTRGGEGAETACGTALRFFLDHAPLLFSAALGKEGAPGTARLVLSAVLPALQARAEAEDADVYDYSSTLCAALLDRRTGALLTFNLGDGLILSAAFRQTGEPTGTEPVTKPDAETDAKVGAKVGAKTDIETHAQTGTVIGTDAGAEVGAEAGTKSVPFSLSAAPIRVLSAPADSRFGCPVTTTEGAEYAADVRVTPGGSRTVALFSDGAWRSLYDRGRLLPEAERALLTRDVAALEHLFAVLTPPDDHSVLLLTTDA